MRRPTVLRIVATIAAITAAVGVAPMPSHADGPPAAPTGLVVTPTDHDVSASWTDVATDETSYEVQRARWVAGMWGEWTVESLPANTTTYSEAAIPDGFYAYLVRAQNASGDSAFAVSTVTVSTAVTAPYQPYFNSVTSSGSTVTLDWGDYAVDELGYEILRARNIAGVWGEWTSFVADIDATSYVDASVPDGFYAYLVRAYNPIGASPWHIATVTVSTTTAPPAAATGLVVTPTGSAVALGWTDNATDETYYEVERARYVEGTWTEWTGYPLDRNTTSTTETSVPDGLYAYLVRATNGSGSSDWAIQTVTVSAASGAPAAPTGLRVNHRLRGGNRVTWVDQSSGSSGELWFDVQRAEFVSGGYANWTSFTADRDTTSLVDTSAVPGASYAYLVRAHNPIGDSSWAVSTVVTDEHALWTVGDNTFGQLGDPSVIASRTTYAQVGTALDWAKVAGSASSLALRRDGTLWAWGHNGEGELGNGTYTSVGVPTQIGTDTWSQIASSLHSLAIRTDGTLWAWGSGTWGQLGDGTSTTRNVPTQIGTASNWVAVAAGSLSSYGIRSDGTLWAWGRGLGGELGTGTSTSSTVPVQVGSDTDWAQISARGIHAMALKTDGTLWTWGINPWGQLGRSGSNSTPGEVGGTWKVISAGNLHSFAIRTDGTLWAWGANFSSQLGDPNYTTASYPIQIGTDADWETVSTAVLHTAAIRTDGTLWAWGIGYGVGSGGFEAVVTPVQIGTGDDWAVIAAGNDHTLAIRD